MAEQLNSGHTTEQHGSRDPGDLVLGLLGTRSHQNPGTFRSENFDQGTFGKRKRDLDIISEKK